jgi:hypothetical protein
MFVGYEPTSVLKFVAMDLYYSLTFDNLFFGYQSVDLLIPSNNAKVTYMTKRRLHFLLNQATKHKSNRRERPPIISRSFYKA